MIASKTIPKKQVEIAENLKAFYSDSEADEDEIDESDLIKEALAIGESEIQVPYLENALRLLLLHSETGVLNQNPEIRKEFMNEIEKFLKTAN